jgi:hypothetical protein
MAERLGDAEEEESWGDGLLEGAFESRLYLRQGKSSRAPVHQAIHVTHTTFASSRSAQDAKESPSRF